MLVPLVAAAIHAVRDGWYPVGDDAYFSLRARDVLSEDHPWLGTWTSASQSAGVNFNNAGPLLFDVLALPSRLSLRLGPMIGTVVLAAASAVGSVVVARRTAGWPGAVTAAIGVLALIWTMGSSVVVEPWQPHSLLLPFVFFATCAWAMVAGHAWGLVGAVAAGSLVVQTHLGYIFLVPGTLAAAAVLLALSLRRRGVERRQVRWIGVAVLVGLLLWAQPIGEQLWGDGEGNLSRIVSVATGPSEQPAVGLRSGGRLFAALVAPWPEWGRDDFADTFSALPEDAGGDDAIEPLRGVPSTAGAAARLIAVAGLVAAAWWFARRRRDAPWVAALQVLAMLLASGLVTVVVLPITQYGVAVHQIRWLWPVAIVATTWIGGAMAGGRWPRWLARASVLIVIGLAVVASVPHRQPVGPIVDDDAMPVMRALAPQLDGATVDGPLLLDEERLQTFEPYSISVVLELDARGVEVVVDDPGLIRQLGSARAADGSERERLLVLRGANPELPAGSRVIAHVDGLGPEAQRTHEQRALDVAARIDAGQVELTDRGRRALAAGSIDWLRLDRTSPDVRALATNPLLAEAVVLGYVADSGGGSALDRWAGLERRRDRATVHVVVAPA